MDSERQRQDICDPASESTDFSLQPHLEEEVRSPRRKRGVARVPEYLLQAARTERGCQLAGYLEDRLVKREEGPLAAGAPSARRPTRAATGRLRCSNRPSC
ncbi:uncharacterized protein LOC116584014 isoform X2 [Mustela erminea]|uniref:uncharacterized protein LOC116584014 isoform X2 n=1 Tax=Mustela erminea TaxID=36723 RepID=UPI001386C4B8|nr:uncharacterized protein LOC116584014 isoform X2 [Mustela erminea]